jgi:hypothetical protein
MNRSYARLWFGVLVLALLGILVLAGSAFALDYSDYWYCNSVEDFLDCRPYYGNTGLVFEPLYLQWAKEQGIGGLEGEILPGQRREALYDVYRLIHKQFLPDVVLAANAPDAGVKVMVGSPNIVMFAPEGKTADREGNIAKLGHLGPSLRAEGRWGQYMFPQLNKLKNGMLLVTVYVGGDSAAGRQYLYYVSDDGGQNWQHFAVYDPAAERPPRDVAPGWNGWSYVDPSEVPPENGQSPRPITKTDGGYGILRSLDGGRTWKHSADVPRVSWFPFRPEISSHRAHLLEFPNGTWVAAYRHNGLYWSGGGPLIITKSTDEGKTWSKPKAIRMPGVNPLSLMLKNGIGVFAYQRPGVFLTFCGDGKGDLWGNDVTLVRAWRNQRDENSDCNGCLLATGPDRFMFAYSKWDVPDPWGQPRCAVIVQEFVVTMK